jgi:hypothetical protein
LNNKFLPWKSEIPKKGVNIIYIVINRSILALLCYNISNMIKKFLSLLIVLTLLSPALFADDISDQQYINKVGYRNNRLELVTKKRQIDETRHYSYTDIDSYTSTYEAFSHTASDISTQSLSRSEVKEVTEWYIYKGGIAELSDIEFLRLIGNKTMLDYAIDQENKKSKIRNVGNILIGVGLTGMIGGAALSAGETIVTGSALGMTAGFFINALNASPAHYIKPDYAQQEITEYNFRLKKKLGLPVDFN